MRSSRRLHGLHSKTTFDLAISYRLPSVSPLRQFVVTGSLISYGSNFDKLFRQAASYSDQMESLL